MMLTSYQSYGTLITWVLAMLLYPESLRKAQVQLDTIVGRDRAPTFEDLDNLPYIRAMINETLRWRTVGPLGSFGVFLYQECEV
jgi:cytochrome P450